MAITGATAPGKTRTDDADLVPVEIKRDQWQRPLILQPDGTSKGYTRASTLGSALEDETNITKWKMGVTLFGAARRRDLVVGAAAVPGIDDKADKQALYKLADQAFERGGGSSKATLGTALHALGEQIDRGEPIPDIGEDRRALEAYAAVMRLFRVVRSEVFIVNDGLQTAGTFDREVEPLGTMVAPDGEVVGPGQTVCLDVKTSSTSDYFGTKFCVQLAVYQGGSLYDPATGARTPLTMNPNWGLILHVPSGGSMAELHWVDLRAGRRLAELSVTVREARKEKNLVRPAALPVLPTIEQVEAMAEAAATGTVPAQRDGTWPITRSPLVDAVEAEGGPLNARAWPSDVVAELDDPTPIADEAVPVAEAAAIGRSLQTAHARRQLAESIARIPAADPSELEAACLALYAANTEIWTEAHNDAVRARLAELAGVA
jgi:hypothetical protein